jgi:hypothetical protein
MRLNHSHVKPLPQSEERADSTTDSDSDEGIAPNNKKTRKYYGASYLHVSSLSNI